MNTLLTYKYWLIGLMVLASLSVSGGLKELRVSHKMDDYFSASGEELGIYTQYREKFGDDDQFILISIASDSGIYEKQFIRDLQKVKEKLDEISGVEGVFWVDEMMPGNLRLRRRFVEKIAGHRLFVSKDHTSASLLILHKYIDQKELMEPMIEEIKEKLDPFTSDQIRIAGKIYLTTVLEKFMKEDSGWLFMLTLLLVVGLLYFMLGSLRLLLISLAVPLCSIVFTMGLMGSLGLHVNLFTTLVPTLILIISVSDILHIVKGAGPQDSIERVKYHFAALLLTTLTTAIGFGSLLTTQIQVLMEFGGFVAIGVLYTFLFTILLFSCVDLKKHTHISFSDKMLTWAIKRIRHVYQKRSLQMALLLSFFVLVIVGIGKVRTNAHLVTGMPRESKVKQDALYFDDKFAGTRPISIFIENENHEQAIDTGVFLRMDSMIKEHLQTQFLIGPHQEGNTPIQVSVEEGRFMRFYGLMKDVGSEIAISRFKKLTEAIQRESDFARLKVRDTGLARMLDKNTTDISASIGTGLITAMLSTFILLSVYFKGIKEALISLVVNSIPLLVLASVYGFLGIELRAGTSVVFTIAFGIAIDDTMHMLASYKKCKARGESFDQVVLDAGKPILMTTIVFGLSFSVLILSGLEAISVLGLSMLIGCVSALLADLFILPGMLKVLDK